MPQTNQANIADDMNRDVTVRLRLTPEEHASWLAAAELEQMTLSQWIRRRCAGLAATPPAPKALTRDESAASSNFYSVHGRHPNADELPSLAAQERQKNRRFGTPKAKKGGK